MIARLVKAAMKALLPADIYRKAAALTQPAGPIQAPETPAKTEEETSLLAGYEESALANVIAAKTRALFGHNISDQPGAERTMMGVLYAARAKPTETLRVLDFGGACGFHYLAAMPTGIPIRWAIVESNAMVFAAKSFETEKFKFFTEIDVAMSWLGGIDLLHSFGALQYVPEPRNTLRDLISLKPPTILWSRLALSDAQEERTLQTSMLSANGPGALPAGFEDARVTYPITRFPERDFVRAHEGYRLVARFGEPSVGFLFERAVNSLGA